MFESDENIAVMKSVPELRSAVLISFARREQGILVRQRNPLGFAGIRDLTSKGARVAVRPPGAGAQLLLESLLKREGLDVSKLETVSPPCLTGPDIAEVILSGRADCGVATRSVANAAGLDFVPLKWEQFDLVISEREYFRPAMQTFFSFLKTEKMRHQAEQAGGYDISVAGQVRFAS